MWTWRKERLASAFVRCAKRKSARRWRITSTAKKREGGFLLNRFSMKSSDWTGMKRVGSKGAKTKGAIHNRLRESKSDGKNASDTKRFRNSFGIGLSALRAGFLLRLFNRRGC